MFLNSSAHFLSKPKYQWAWAHSKGSVLHQKQSLACWLLVTNKFLLIMVSIVSLCIGHNVFSSLVKYCSVHYLCGHFGLHLDLMQDNLPPQNPPHDHKHPFSSFFLYFNILGEILFLSALYHFPLHILLQNSSLHSLTLFSLNGFIFFNYFHYLPFYLHIHIQNYTGLGKQP